MLEKNLTKNLSSPYVSFDVKHLTVSSALVNGKERTFDILPGVSTADGRSIGDELRVYVPSTTSGVISVEIRYCTEKEGTAVQWIDPEQTVGKSRPYMFTQCQAVHARSLLPCQDAPSVKVTYNASVTVDDWCTCLMSALEKGKTKSDAGGKVVWSWEQPLPVSSYLIAFCVGELESRDISDRCKVWAEPGIVEAAAEEFSETEKFLATAEYYAFEYPWKRYDLVCLPPSFPYGGMENPNLTFVTPTLIAGDKSLADVVAHEICHSWSGNLVTNATWEHFWLNEGWTMWLQRKVVSRVKGSNMYFDFDALSGWKHLTDDVKLLPDDFTRLVPVLDGVDPDDAFSGVPYEKGFNILLELERRVTTPAFEQFAKSYLLNFKFITVTSQEFKDYFMSYFKGHEMLEDFDWDMWYHKPGLPKVPEFDRTLSKASEDLADLWVHFNKGLTSEIPDVDITSWGTDQITCFLDALLESDEKITKITTRKMSEKYGFSKTMNSEILHRFCLLSVAAEDSNILPVALKFITSQGRMKYVRPLYRALYASKIGKRKAIETFKSNYGFYHAIAAKMIAIDMSLTSPDSDGLLTRAFNAVRDGNVLAIGTFAAVVAAAGLVGIHFARKRK